MKKKRLLIVGLPLKLELLLRFKDENKELILFAHEYYVDGLGECRDHYSEIVPFSGEESFLKLYKMMLRSCIEHGCTAIVPFKDELLVPAAMVGAHASLLSHSESSVSYCQDKAKMRAQLDIVGINNVKWRECSSEEEVKAFLRANPSGVFIKPLWGCGSVGCFKLKHEEDIAEAFECSSTSSWTRSGSVLCEQYIEGTLYSVEGYSVNGEYFPLAITEARVNGEFGEISHLQPSSLDSVTRRELFSYTESILNAIGFDVGVSHVELILQGEGVYLIEVNGRVGGDRIDELTALTLGVDLFEIQCRLFAEEDVPLVNQDSARNAAYICFKDGKLGETVGAIQVPDSARAKNGIVHDLRACYAAGETVNKLDSRFGRVGVVLVSAETNQAAIDCGDSLLSEMEVEYI